MKADRVFSPWADRWRTRVNRPKQLSVAANSYKWFGNAYASEALGAQCKPARYWAHHERLSWGFSFRTLPRTQTSLFSWKCARKGRREEPFPWSLAVHHQSLVSRSPLPCEKRSAWGGGCFEHVLFWNACTTTCTLPITKIWTEARMSHAVLIRQVRHAQQSECFSRTTSTTCF